MQYPVNIKISPLALVKNIIAVELSAGLLLFATTLLANYQTAYHLLFAGIIRYDYFLIMAASFSQIIITLTIFLKWHNENYEIKETEILNKRGVFNITQHSLPIADIKSAVLRQSLLERLTNCGTIIIQTRFLKNIFIRNAENAEAVYEAIKTFIEKNRVAKLENQKKISIQDLIHGGENNNLEFKQTLRWDSKQGTINKDLEKAVMKTVASFLNTNGGNFIIGVADNKNIYGLESDYKTLSRQDRDGFENHFNNIFQSMLGSRFRQFVNVNFEKINNSDVCLIEVKPADSQVYLKQNNSEEFFIRTGNTTSALSMSEADKYIKSHWG